MGNLVVKFIEVQVGIVNPVAKPHPADNGNPHTIVSTVRGDNYIRVPTSSLRRIHDLSTSVPGEGGAATPPGSIEEIEGEAARREAAEFAQAWSRGVATSKSMERTNAKRRALTDARAEAAGADAAAAAERDEEHENLTDWVEEASHSAAEAEASLQDLKQTVGVGIAEAAKASEIKDAEFEGQRVQVEQLAQQAERAVGTLRDVTTALDRVGGGQQHFQDRLEEIEKRFRQTSSDHNQSMAINMGSLREGDTGFAHTPDPPQSQ